MEDKLNLKSVFVYIALPYFCLVAFHIILASNISAPTIWPDDFINFFKAKYLIEGKISSNLIIPTQDIIGTFGYSVLISPLLLIFKEPITAYKGILLLNCFLSSTIYIGLFIFLRQILNSDVKKSLLTSLIVSLYPAYILQSNNAYADSIAPTLFLFGLISFYYLVKKQNFIYLIIFSLINVFIFWLNIRFLPYTIVALIILFYITYKKQFKLSLAISTTFLIAIFLIIGIHTGDALTKGITGVDDITLTNLTVLINMLETLMIFLFIYLFIFYLVTKQFIFFFFTLIGFISGILSNNNLWFLFLVPLGTILIYLLLMKGNYSKKRILFGVILSIIIAITFNLLLPEYSDLSYVFNKLKTWIVNLSGTVYYVMFSTFLLFFIGFVFILIKLWHQSVIKPSEEEMEKNLDVEFKNKFTLKHIISNPSNSTILFMLLASLACLFISIFPSSFETQHYRADLLFYGRNIELILAGFLAFSIYQLKESDPKDYLIAIISTLIFFSFFSIIMILSYDNIVSSEAAFKSIISFFPLRAILGNINIFIYSSLAFVIGILFIIFHRYKPLLTSILLSSIFISFSLFTYNYVDLYTQESKLNRTKLVDYINEYFPDIPEIDYDKLLYCESSQNGLSYAFYFWNKRINFVDSSNFKSGLIISNSEFGLKDIDRYTLLAIEHDGQDYLWADKTIIDKKLLDSIVPSFLDLPLNKSWVGGVSQIGFYEDYWINNRAEIGCPLRKQDSLLSLKLIINSTLKENSTLNLQIKGICDTSLSIQPGLNKVSLDFNNNLDDKYLKCIMLSKLVNDKTSNYYGLQLKSIIITNQEKKIYQSTESKEISENDISNFLIQPRANIDLARINLKPKDSITIPVVIFKKGSSSNILINSSYQIGYRWRDFIFKSITKSYTIPINQVGKCESDGFIETMLTIYYPEQEKKYFLEFGLVDKNNNWINPHKNRMVLFNFKPKKKINAK